MACKFADVNEAYIAGIVQKEHVEALQEWMENQPHLPKIAERDIVLFLHSCHCSNEAAKKCIDTYYTIRTHCFEFFKGQDPRQNPKLFDTALYSVLPKRTKDGYQIFLGTFIDHKIHNYHFDKVIKALDMAVMLGLHQYGPAEGFVFLQDLSGLTISHLTKTNLLLLKKFFTYLQEALPIRLKGLHFINIVPFMDILMATIRPFLKEELRKFIYLHTDFDSLNKHIDPQCLPVNFGGTEPSISELKKIMEKDVVDNADFFIDLERKIVDESKRPGKPRSVNDFFGIEGTFRKFSID